MIDGLTVPCLCISYPACVSELCGEHAEDAADNSSGRQHRIWELLNT